MSEPDLILSCNQDLTQKTVRIALDNITPPYTFTLYPDEVSREQARADYLLRQAAPDMLAALKLALPTGICLTNKNVPDSTTVPVDISLGDLRKIAAAIAKAEAQS